MRPFAATKNEPLCEYSILSKDTCTFNLPSVNQMSRTLNDVTEEFKFCFSCKWKMGPKWIILGLCWPYLLIIRRKLFGTKNITPMFRGINCHLVTCILQHSPKFSKMTKVTSGYRRKNWIPFFKRSCLSLWSWYRQWWTRDTIEHCIPHWLPLIMHDDRHATLYTCERNKSSNCIH